MRKRKNIGVLLLALLPACAYRFTNTAIQPPAGIRSVAVEAIYDTSRTVLPHEILWESLQRSLAENGRLRLTSQDKADALLRAHITAASVNPTGGAENDEMGDKDPVLPKNPADIKPEEYRKITSAGTWTTKESVGYTVVVELWDLRNRKMLFQRTYSGQDIFQSVLGEEQAQLSMQYLLYEESLTTKFRQIAKTISDRAVADIFFN